jgi:hypothetical protein
MRMTTGTSWLKLVLGFGAVFLFRFLLLPIRAPNVEPLMATVMPFSKRFGALTSFLFAFLSIVAYDAVTSGWGVWTAAAALAYGFVALLSHRYFRNREASTGHFVGFGIVATLIYDALTGLTVGPIIWHQPLAAAFVGQIPFTLMHLAGTVTFALFLSPAIYRYVVANEALQPSLVWKRVLPFAHKG